MQRPFRFGILSEEMGTCTAWLEKARRLEQLGYSTLLLRDHFINRREKTPPVDGIGMRAPSRLSGRTGVHDAERPEVFRFLAHQ